MGSIFAPLKRGYNFKIRIVYTILAWLVAQTMLAVPATFTVESTERNETVLHNSVALLPFENLSPNPDDTYFSVGIHQEILDHLSKIRNINMISRLSVLRYENDNRPVSEIASELNVATIMKGRVGYIDNQITIALQLFDASNNDQLWSKVYERELSDIFTIQAEIVGYIALALEADISAAEQKRIENVPTHSLEAYVLYLKAKAVPSIIGVVKPHVFYDYLEQAIALDPDFAIAHAYKASGYAFAKRVGRRIKGLTPDEMEKVALEHAEIALALDTNLGLAHRALAEIHRSHQRETEAKEAFERALLSNPNDVEIMGGYARSFTALEKHDEAARVSWRVLDLAPNDANNYYLLGRALMYAGNPAAAVDQFRLGNTIEPNFYRYLNLCLAEILLGNNTEAEEAIRHAEQLIDASITTRGAARVAYAYSRLGLSEDALRVFNLVEERVANGKFISAEIRALSYLAIGENDKAYDALSRNLKEGITPLKEIKANLLNSPVLDEPRFVELRKRIGS